MGKAEKKRESWQERRKRIKHKWAVPFIYVEWICEQVSYLLGRWAFLDILGHVGRFGILVSIAAGAYVYVMEADERLMQAENERQQAVDQRKAKHYQAWQVINAAQGKTGDGGRMDALQDLNGDGISLAGVDISKAYLRELNLENAQLRGANLAGTYLEDANLAGADLVGANLARANLTGANLAGADLDNADLTGADLTGANLHRAGLRRAKFAEADLDNADLVGADLFGASLAGANLDGADLAGANLTYVDLAEAVLTGADLPGATLMGADLAGADLFLANLTGANLMDADLAGAVLRSANFAKAGLFGASLAGANLLHADLAGTYLVDADLAGIENWRGIQGIELATIYGVKDPPEGFTEWATENGAVNIESFVEWMELIREQTEEKKEQEAGTSRGDQEKAGEK